MSGLVNDALCYAARGWSIVPVKDKKPALRSWKRYQTERATESRLRRWFARNGVTGLAVVCGPVSGGLVVRDFDASDAYSRWSAEYPTLVDILPTVQTARGFHVYFTGDCDRIVSVDNGGVHEGELRGCGIILLPPSRHPSGAVYRWTVPLPDGPIPAVDAVLAGLLPENLDTLPIAASQTDPLQQRGQREQRRQRKQRITEITEDMVCEGCLRDLSKKRVAEILYATLPYGPGQRNRAVFNLARELQGEEAFRDADPRDLRPIVGLWHKAALPVIRTQPFEYTWVDFMRTWPKVKYPKGAGPMDMIFEQATASDPPEAALRYGIPVVRQLVSLCRELQRAAGDGPFYLACRTAGKLLGVSHSKAADFLFLLKTDGVLEETEKGGQFRATRYRYVAGDDEGTARRNDT